MSAQRLSRFFLGLLVASAFLAGCNGAQQLALSPIATHQLAIHALNARVLPLSVQYELIDLGALGGDGSDPNSVNDHGWVAGDSAVPNSSLSHAALWVDGRPPIDLGNFGGAACVCWPVKTSRNELAGESQTTQLDPLGENFCSQNWPTSYVCLGFRWRDGKMTALPTLGGNNDQATGENDRGQIVGAAETPTQDASCASPQLLDYDAVVWQPDGTTKILPPLPGDAVAGAAAVNNQGDVAGGSGACGPPYNLPFGTTHALVWHEGSPRNLGSLGGTIFNAALAINDRGNVAGVSGLPGNSIYHAFFWQRGVMTDLGTLPGDIVSAALGMNNNDDVVGQSCDPSGNCRGFLWKDGSMKDLNQMVSHISNVYIVTGHDINDRGWIVGQTYNLQTNLAFAFLAIPSNSDRPSQYSQSARKVMLPEAFRMQVLHRTTFRPTLNGSESPR